MTINGLSYVSVYTMVRPTSFGRVINKNGVDKPILSAITESGVRHERVLSDNNT